MTAADLLIKYLVQQGVEHVFGIIGGALEPFYSAIHKNKEITSVLTKHEQGAAFMADGYARVSGRLGVCCGTTGPGSTNLITAVASSYADSIPVLVITAQVPTKSFGKGALQDSTHDGVNIVDIFKHFTKFSAMVINPDKMGEIIQQALRFALCGRRGPVHLNIPADVMAGKVNEGTLPTHKFIPVTTYFDRYSIRRAANLILNAKKPAMLLGNGSIVSGSTNEVIKFAEMLSIPVATTPKAKGAFPENHHLSLGVFGQGGSPRAASYLLNGKNDCDGSNPNILNSKVDVLLSVGTSFNEWGTHAWDKRLAPEKAMIQVDIDPYELGKNYPFEVELIGDARIIMRELTYELLRQIKSLPREKNKRREEKTRLMKESLEYFKDKTNRYIDEKASTSDMIPIKPQRLMRDLRESLPQEALFFVDIGNNLLWALHYLEINGPKKFFSGLGFASMGFGVAAVGAKFAAPDKTVVAVIGDGGFLMNGMEVATSVNYNKPVIWVVENNSQFGMVSHARKLLSIHYDIGENFKRVDCAKIAEGLGATGITVTKPGEINKSMMNEIVKSGKTTVIDVIIDKDEIPPLHARVKAMSGTYF